MTSKGIITEPLVLYRRNLKSILLPSSMDGKGDLREAGSADSAVAKAARLDANLSRCSYWSEPYVHLRRRNWQEGAVSPVPRDAGRGLRDYIRGNVSRNRSEIVTRLRYSFQNSKLRTIPACNHTPLKCWFYQSTQPMKNEFWGLSTQTIRRSFVRIYH